jgi:hypothetical protein
MEHKMRGERNLSHKKIKLNEKSLRKPNVRTSLALKHPTEQLEA